MMTHTRTYPPNPQPSKHTQDSQRLRTWIQDNRYLHKSYRREE